jgi:hypothetical protein
MLGSGAAGRAGATLRFSVGKWRKLEIVPSMARMMAASILQQAVLEDDGKAVEPTTI